MRRVSLIIAVASVAALAPATGLAQSTFILDEPNNNVEVMVQGGALDFMDAGLDKALEAGGAWGVRAVVLPRSIIGGEIGYLGGINDVRNNRTEFPGAEDLNDLQLLTSSAEALLRTSVMEIAGIKSPIAPYVGAGVGVTNHQLVGNDADQVTGKLDDGDTTAHIPAVVGVQASIASQVVIDGRIGYRYLFDDDFTERKDDAQSWVAMAGLGWRF